ncbi:Uncharacterized protein FWK35_00032712 [Aphis craccivora]|uniref:Uncharacterized protein n=2 Tax=Aphis craccivora TaxID=307492 RepID=A0A6G0XCE5_APHCR|nr:Uncharacterized protein FWK35_00032712 [Aphis craccivora]
MHKCIIDSKWNDECIDFTMIINCRNNASISNFEGGFRWQIEYPWYIIKVKNSERSDECIDFTMIITSRNNAPISNYGGGFPIGKKLTFSNSFQKNLEKQKKKMTEKREFLRKTSFRPNRFFYMVVIQKLITINT